MNINTPNWVKDAVFYQIFPDRFAVGKPDQKYPNHWQSFNLQPWDNPPTLQKYKGGNFWGVIDKLDYLQDLGINAIYFTPVFQSTCNHRYHTHDYYQIDPLLGGNYAFQELLKQAHQRNIKVVLDGVFNHVGRGFFFFNDILENGPHSPWLDWFKIEKWPISAYNGAFPANYASWVNNRALPQFNHSNPQVKEYIMQVAEYWLHQGIDGWRLDVPNEIEEEGFWQEFRERVKGVNPDAYIVGEIWTDARQWLDGNQFDGVMNYLFTAPTMAFCGGDRILLEYVEQPCYEPYPAITAEEYQQKIEKLLDMYDWEITLTQLNLLASHDTARLLTIAGDDKKTVELCTLLLLTFPGAPSIYYGDEVGLPGGFDPDSRRGFPEESLWDKNLLNYHKELIKLRHQYPALRRGKYQVLCAQEDIYIFTRILDKQKIIVAINNNTQAQSITIEVDHQIDQILFGDGTFSCEQENYCNYLTVGLNARSGLILI
ncbi:glycoside hydrolase family 13 protein [Cyanobacterium stanieri LEGE 03274]|uniref:Glycoside hydrolase family 13 protein n=1 Tax=Cyanobacterium stanieri LEGE 03274 TaxID=1828756 RepID=A0ABR9V655_9CHRO|nr:glycoside hydrolase family 13 protein [Cyanobacterium stanieri]MBE9223367.1 glycoside hydrolase family 13 protein [Cyanobacterium stanieri LEGE 03274]